MSRHCKHGILDDDCLDCHPVLYPVPISSGSRVMLPRDPRNKPFPGDVIRVAHTTRERRVIEAQGKDIRYKTKSGGERWTTLSRWKAWAEHAVCELFQGKPPEWIAKNKPSK